VQSGIIRKCSSQTPIKRPAQRRHRPTQAPAAHRAAGGKMVDFGGWDMPVQYAAGVIEEHMATRTRAGLFDVSHMGEIWVEGPDAIKFVNRLTTNDTTQLVDGQAQHAPGSARPELQIHERQPVIQEHRLHDLLDLELPFVFLHHFRQK